METVGYKLVDENGLVISSWGGVWGQCPAIPNFMILPNGDHVHCPEIGVPYSGCSLLPWEMGAPEPSPVASTVTVEDLVAKLEAVQAEFALISAKITALKGG
jgi:hypothetical protein